MKAALVGTGNIARQHLAVLRTLPGVSVVAVCDRSRAAAEASAERFGAARWFTDHRAMLEAVEPDVVHVTTPPSAHAEVAADALDAGAHVIVEKPLAPSYGEVEDLVNRAAKQDRTLAEDYNYLFNRSMRDLLHLLASGRAGPAAHADVTLCAEPGSGTLADYVSHLASLAHAVAGAHRRVDVTRCEPGDLRALVEGERATTAVVFTTAAAPDTFTVTVYATHLRATARLWEPGLFVEPVRPGVSRPLAPLVNGLAEAWTAAGAAVSGLWGKLNGGPGSYEGLWHLLGRTYRAIETGQEPPVSLDQILAVNRLVADLTP